MGKSLTLIVLASSVWLERREVVTDRAHALAITVQVF
jgi:hypothetical protein